MADDNGLITLGDDNEAASPVAQGILDRIGSSVKEKLGIEVPSIANPGVSFADDEHNQQARDLVEHYQMQKSQQNGTFKGDMTKVPPPDDQSAQEYGRNAINFMFGDTAAAAGIKLNQDGIDFSLDTMRSMWSDHPWRAGLAVAADGGPLLAGGFRVARMLRGASADIDAGELVAKGLATTVEDYNAMTPAAKDIVQGQAKRIADLTETRTAVDNGTATPWQKAKNTFDQMFGNSYLDSQTLTETNPDAAIQDWRTKTADIVKGRTVSGLLDLADEVKPGEGSAVLHAIQDPSQLGSLSPKARELALGYSAEGREVQKQALAEGFIDQETADKVGPVWFSAMRKDSPIFEQGASTESLSVIRRKAGEGGKTGDLRVVNIPRTGGPNLLKRDTDQAGVLDLIKKQRASEALEAGKSDAALKLLQGSPDEDAIGSLIQTGQKSAAQTALAKNGFLQSDPQQLVVNSIQQKLLFENFRTLRDVALNPDITKTAEEVAAMSTGTRRRMISLDRVQNAGILRRMVAIKKGVPAVGDLGFIDQSLFKQVAQLSDHGTTNQFASWLQFSTAMLKTAKTALNPFTHGQNMSGNMAFLWMAGMGLDDQFVKGRAAWKAINAFSDARKAGTAMQDVGVLKSMVKGGKDINIADEMAHPLLTGPHGLLDTSSLTQAEGLPIMQRLYDQAGDHQGLLKSAINLVQKGAKKNVLGLSAEKASNIYQVEDSAAKFSYYLHLRQQGLNELAASNEVAKRLPMYGTAGNTIQGLRKAALPWLSFPTEATRIMKNNIMDHPFRTATVMNIPNILQTAVGTAGGMSYETGNSLRDQNPMWAQTPGNVVVPSALTDPLQNDANKGQVRTFLMQMLPHLALMPQSEAADAGLAEKLPMGVGNPFPIIMGFVNALTGKNSFGQDVVTDPNDPTAKMKAIILNTLGTMAPPMFEKYLMNPGLPTTYYRAGIDSGQLTNPSTGQTGSPFFDLLENNFLVKSYGGSPDTQVSNERYGARQAADYRGRLGRELRAWTMSGDQTNVYKVLSEVHGTFDQEMPNNPAMAHRKYLDWVNMHARDVIKNPSFNGLSKQDFQNKLAAEADNQTADMNEARKAYIDSLREGFRQAGGRSQPGTNPLKAGRIKGQ